MRVDVDRLRVMSDQVDHRGPRARRGQGSNIRQPPPVPAPGKMYASSTFFHANQALKYACTPWGRYPLGQISDDTQCAAELALSIVEKGRFDVRFQTISDEFQAHFKPHFSASYYRVSEAHQAAL